MKFIHPLKLGCLVIRFGKDYEVHISIKIFIYLLVINPLRLGCLVREMLEKEAKKQ